MWDIKLLSFNKFQGMKIKERGFERNVFTSTNSKTECKNGHFERFSPPYKHKDQQKK